MSRDDRSAAMKMPNLNLNLVPDDPSFIHVVKEVSTMVSKMAGIQLGDRQHAMVENRLRSRMIKLGLKTADEYLKYMKTHTEQESQALLSLMTTHHTYFFREFSHFEFLQNKGLERAIQGVRSRGEKKIKIWSGACSRGQEVYSLAMFMSLVLPKMAPDLDFEILGTDVDPESVGIAKNGVYHFREIKEVPAPFLADHWARGKAEIADYVKAKNSLREKVKFDTMNLHQPNHVIKGQKYDIIFCRNVFIYFSQEQIANCAKTFLEHLHSEGYLFVGISETLTGLSLPIDYVGPSVYEHRFGKAAFTSKASSTVSARAQAAENVVPLKPVDKKPATPAPLAPTSSAVTSVASSVSTSGPLKVLCVDDSGSILTLLKKILTKDDGFEVVGTAGNGFEAAEFLSKNKVDLMTLDIHMPGMDGLTYLEKHYNASHPPVVMLSSVTRENATTAVHAIELGASDYIEKPTLANLTERGDEIRSKLKTAMFMKGLSKPSVSQVDRSFKKDMKITNPEKKLRVVFAGLGHKKELMSVVKYHQSSDPSLLIVFDGAQEALGAFSQSFEKECGKKINLLQNDLTKMAVGQIYFVESKNAFAALKAVVQGRKVSLMVLGMPTKLITDFVMKTTENTQVVLEDMGVEAKKIYGPLLDKADSIVPATSYMSVSEEYFG
jgi:chemotaxis protein methyltransferase CheR